MTISTQQIKTVLRTYNKQLKLAGLNKTKKHKLPQSKKDEVTISVEAKRQRIYQQAANHIVEKLTNNDTASPKKLIRSRKV